MRGCYGALRRCFRILRRFCITVHLSAAAFFDAFTLRFVRLRPESTSCRYSRNGHVFAFVASSLRTHFISRWHIAFHRCVRLAYNVCCLLTLRTSAHLATAIDFCIFAFTYACRRASDTVRGRILRWILPVCVAAYAHASLDSLWFGWQVGSMASGTRRHRAAPRIAIHRAWRILHARQTPLRRPRRSLALSFALRYILAKE